MIRQYLDIVGVLGTHAQKTHSNERYNQQDDVYTDECPLVGAILGVSAVGASAAVILTLGGVVSCRAAQLIVAQIGVGLAAHIYDVAGWCGCHIQCVGWDDDGQGH